MENQLLRDLTVPPTNEVLEMSLGECFETYQKFIESVKAEGMATGWNYYKDGKAWLCKITYKNKTVCWLSVWDKYFKLGFYFSAKNCSGVSDLPIDETIKIAFNESPMQGRLKPLVIKMTQTDQIDDVMKIADFKKNLKR